MKHLLHRVLLPLLLAAILCLSACFGANPLDDLPDTFGDTAGEGTSESDATPTESDSSVTAGGESESRPSAHDGHTDKDDDGLCDDCRVSVIVEIALFAINDLHGKFTDTDSQPGVDELTTYLGDARGRYDGTVLLSSGDMWQGSSESNLTRGQIVTEWMNELDFVSMTLGNHEYDWGEASIEANAALAEFPFLAINVYDRDTGARADYCDASVMVDAGGIQIGIIGAIGDCYSSISGEMSGDVYFRVGSDLTALVKAESTRLREAGADLVVYSLHDGCESARSLGVLTDSHVQSYYDPTLSDGYVDVVFEGHTHQNYALPDEEGIFHVQNGGENRGIGRVVVEYNVANGHYTTDSATVIPSSTYDDADPDPIVEQLMEQYADKVGVGQEVLGYNGAYRSSDSLCDLVARLYYETGVATWGDAYDIVLGGGYLKTRSPYSLPVGDVLYADLQSLLPFDNTLVLCSVKGSDLAERFVYTDNQNYHNHYGTYGQSLVGSIDPNATYYVVVDSYTSTYAPNRLTEIERYDATVFARDLVADYIRAGGME